MMNAATGIKIHNMKKAVLLLFILITLVSCSSVKKQIKRQKDIRSEENASFAMSWAMSKAHSNACNELRIYVNGKESFIPATYTDYFTSYDIPGLNTFISSFNTYMRSYIIHAIDELEPVAARLVSDMVFQNATYLAYISDVSGTSYFRDLYYGMIHLRIREVMTSADYTYIEKAVELFNSYAVVQNHFSHNATVNEIKPVQYVELYTDIMTEEYFRILASCEELVRTTPDPYADKRVSNVFGTY